MIFGRDMGALSTLTLSEGPLIVVDALTVAPGDRVTIEGWKIGVSFRSSRWQKILSPYLVIQLSLLQALTRRDVLQTNATRSNAKLLLSFSGWSLDQLDLQRGRCD